MSIQSNFYQTRATEERDKATASTLHNVREGHLRAAAAWDALAARSLKADRMRVEEERRKSEVRAADADLRSAEAVMTNEMAQPQL
ncbi:MAG TPA: hypothetical protein VNI79_08865 [Sphingomicrobium sp.]|nr:hypothetical protein [Sphingomicrobium sp.]